MSRLDTKALEITKEIVVAHAQNSNMPCTKEGGECIAEFFKEIYKGVKEITDSIE